MVSKAHLSLLHAWNMLPAPRWTALLSLLLVINTHSDWHVQIMPILSTCTPGRWWYALKQNVSRRHAFMRQAMLPRWHGWGDDITGDGLSIAHDLMNLAWGLILANTALALHALAVREWLWINALLMEPLTISIQETLAITLGLHVQAIALLTVGLPTSFPILTRRVHHLGHDPSVAVALALAGARLGLPVVADVAIFAASTVETPDLCMDEGARLARPLIVRCRAHAQDEVHAGVASARHVRCCLAP